MDGHFIIEAQVRGIRPRISRLFRVRKKRTLKQLHEILQVLFGWQDYHLYSFTIDGASFEDLAHWEPFNERDEPPREVAEVTVREVLAPLKRFQYAYDFGDSWEVALRVLEARDEDLPDECLLGQRAGPPEDCGGTSGYAELVATLRRPRSEAYAEMRQWVGKAWEAEKFDIDLCNRALRRRFPAPRATTSRRVGKEPETYDPSSGYRRLEHYPLHRLSVWHLMIVALREEPRTLDELKERLEAVDVTLPHGLTSLRKAWKRRPPIREQLDGKLEVMLDHPAYRMEEMQIDAVLPLAAPPPPPSEETAAVEIDVEARLRMDELERLQTWPYRTSLRRQLMILLDARGSSTLAELVTEFNRLLKLDVRRFHHSSWSGDAFTRTGEHLAVVPSHPHMREARRAVRMALHELEVRAAEAERSRFARCSR